MRVISICLASATSCSRVSSGISPICVRYMRTGSSDHDSSSDPGQQIVGVDVQLRIVFFVVVQDRAVQIVFDIKHFDRIVHQIQRLLGPRNRFVFQAVQQCVVQNTTPQVSKNVLCAGPARI